MLTGQILIQLITILLVVQVFGYGCSKIGQQWVIGEILAGLALGPSLLGALWPGLEAQLFPPGVRPTLQTLGDLGLIFYMFALGSRLDIQLMLNQSRRAAVVSLCGIFLPFALGLSLGFVFFPVMAGPRANLFSFMLTVGTSMAITAFPVLARLLVEKNMLGTRIGMLALTCASVDDVIAWCLLAFVVATSYARGPLVILFVFGETALFIASMFLVVRPLLRYITQYIQSSQLQVALIIVILLASAYTTNLIGIHPVFGAFFAGLILPRTMLFAQRIRSLTEMSDLLLLPLFFVFSGLNTSIGLIQNASLWLICLLMLFAACFGKLAAAIVATRLMGESWKGALTIGVLMNTRGLVELIVLNIGLQLGILSTTLFSILVVMAIVTTMMASPILWLLGYRSSPDQRAQTEVVVQTSATTD